MLPRLLTLVAFVFALTPLAIRAADGENPFKKVRVGEFAKYDVTLTANSSAKKFTRVQTVTAVTDKEVTLRTASYTEEREIPTKNPEQKIDLTKPFATASSEEVPGTGSLTWEKLKDGKEKIKVGATEYECTWTTFKPVSAKPGAQVTGELKVWQSKDVPFVVKRTLKLQLGSGLELAYDTQLVELGFKK